MVYDQIINIAKKNKHETSPQENKTKGTENSYFKSNYFAENRETYEKKNDEDADPMHVFDRINTEDTQKVPYIDNFFTRYVYLGFIRWCKNIGKYAGVVKDT